jgi:hypothetical protein
MIGINPTDCPFPAITQMLAGFRFYLGTKDLIYPADFQLAG